MISRSIASPRKCAVLLIIFMFFRVFVVHNSAVYGSDAASSAIDQAENSVRQAFVVVLRAEGAGANVSGLLVRLNAGEQLIVAANTALQNGDDLGARSLSSDCSNLMGNLTTDAESLRADAETATQTRLFWTFSVASIGLALLFSIGLVVWRLLRSFYLKRLMKMQVEVPN